MSPRSSGFVADDDGVDVAVLAGQLERGADFRVVAVLVLFAPAPTVTFMPNSAAIGRHQFGAAWSRE